MIKHLLSLILLFPLLGAFIIIVMPIKKEAVTRNIASIFSFITFALCLFLVQSFDPSSKELTFVENFAWLESYRITFALGVNGAGILGASLLTLIFFLATSFRWKTAFGHKGFFSLLLFFETMLIGIYFAQDLFLFFMFWTASIVPPFLITNIWGEKDREAASTQFFLFQLFGCAFILMGMFVAYFSVNPHSFSFIDLSGNHFKDATLTFNGKNFAMDKIVYMLFLIGFCIRLPIVPFHRWMVSFYKQTHPVLILVLISSAFTQTAAFAVHKWCFPLFPEAAKSAVDVLVVLSVVSILYASACALTQRNLRSILSYIFTAHMGLQLLGISLLSEASMQGALVHIFSYGVFAALMSFLVAALGEQAKSYDVIDENGKSTFGNLVSSAPWLTAFFAIGMFSGIGIPGFGSFTANVMILLGAYPKNAIISILGLLGILIIAGCFVWMFRKVFLGFGQASSEFTDLSPQERLCLAPLVILCFVLGFFPTPFIRLSAEYVTQLMEIWR